MARDIKLGWDVESLNKAYRQGYMAAEMGMKGLVVALEDIASAVLIGVKLLSPPGTPVGKTPTWPANTKSRSPGLTISCHRLPEVGVT